MNVKLLKIISDATSCSQDVVHVPVGDFWKYMRTEIADYGSFLADLNDWGAEKFAKKVSTELLLFGKFEDENLIASRSKGALGTDTVSLTIKEDDDTYTITYIILPDYPCKDEYVAAKLWTRADVMAVLKDRGYKGTDEQIDAVINTGMLKSLGDCTEQDWEIIELAVTEAERRNEL